MAGAAKSQGGRFENTLAKLLQVVLADDLHLRSVQVEPLGGGNQYGADLRVSWLSPEGEPRLWLVECKSDARRPLPEEKIGSKLLQVARSAIEPDVWCLALSDVEPSPTARESLADSPRRLGVTFAVTVLSPMQGGIKRLYACHPRLAAQQYGNAAQSVTRGERTDVIAAFREWLERESRAKPEPVPAGWDLVNPASFELLPDDPGHASRYLRARTATCPWEAIVYGWAVSRPSAEVRLLKVVNEAEAGIAADWLVGAGGEGKSTVLKRVAWEVASDPAWYVLWGEADGGTCQMPIDWIRSRESGARVLVCVDGTKHLTGLRQALDEHELLAAADQTVVVLLVDRGIQWLNNRKRFGLGRKTPRPSRLGPLAEPERVAVAQALEGRNLLQGKSVDQALNELDAAAAGAADDLPFRRWSRERSWLVPTVMSLTDPAGRGFEEILQSILTQLYDEDQKPALRLLLGIALVHAAGDALPEDVADGLIGGQQGLSVVLDVLSAELEPDGLGSPHARSDTMGRRFLTHGYVVSRGFVAAAGSDGTLRGQLSEVCVGLPEAMRGDYTPANLLPDRLFDILHSVTEYLDGDARMSDQAALLLERWCDIDPTAWPARHRLVQAILHSLAREVRSSSPDEAWVSVLVARAEAISRDALRTAERVLRDPNRSTRYASYDLAEERRIIYHGWAVAELAVGEPRDARPGSQDRLRRACFLALMALDVCDREQVARCCGVAIQSLFHLGRVEAAARWAAVDPDGRVATRFLEEFEKRDVELLADRDEALDVAVADLAQFVIADHEVIGVARDVDQHTAMVVDQLRHAGESLPTNPATSRIIEAITGGTEPSAAE